MGRAGSGLLAMLLASACSGQGPSYPTVTRTEVRLSHERPLTDVDRAPIQDITIEESERTATVTYLGGTYSCFYLDRVEVAYEPERLVVTVYEGVIFPEDPRPNDEIEVACTSIGLNKKVTVALSQPVDGRRFVDGACVDSEEPRDSSCREKYS